MYADNDALVRFFARMPEMLPVYQVFEQRVNERCGDVDVRVQKTQITFTDRYGFAWASLPVRRRRDWPERCLIVTFGLAYRKESPRIAIATEPYPHRWTHHVLVERAEDIDDELMGWVEESHAFSLTKRPRRGVPRCSTRCSRSVSTAAQYHRAQLECAAQSPLRRSDGVACADRFLAFAFLGNDHLGVNACGERVRVSVGAYDRPVVRGDGRARVDGVHKRRRLRRIHGVRASDGHQRHIAAHLLVLSVLVGVAGNVDARTIHADHVPEPAVRARVLVEPRGVGVVGTRGLDGHAGNGCARAGAHELGGEVQLRYAFRHARGRYHHGVRARYACDVLGREVVEVRVRDKHRGGIVGGVFLGELEGIEIHCGACGVFDADGAVSDNADAVGDGRDVHACSFGCALGAIMHLAGGAAVDEGCGRQVGRCLAWLIGVPLAWPREQQVGEGALPPVGRENDG